MTQDSVSLVTDAYNTVYSSIAASPTLQAIWRDHARGGDYPDEFSHISFLTLAEAKRLVTELRLASGDLLVDLACGAGGPGLWMARETGAKLMGIDASSIAVSLARSRALELGLGDRSSFEVGLFGSLPVEDGRAQGCTSVDALQYAPNKGAALSEAFRILQPSGRFAFIAFELDPAVVSGLPVMGVDPVDDYSPLLERTGFEVLAYEETPGWHERVTTTYEKVMGSSEILRSEMGASAFDTLALEVSITLERRPYLRRVLAVAAKPTA